MLHPWGSPRTMDGSYDQVFQATLEVLEAREFPITKAARETGDIETGKRPVDGLEPSHPVETVQARVKRQEGGTSVRLMMTFLEPRPDDPGSRLGEDEESQSDEAVEKAIDRSAIYDEYLDAIERRVRDLRGEREERRP